MRTPYLIDNIDVHTWYYRAAPEPGDTVAYMNEDFIDTVARVTTLAIWFESGHMMRRPYLFGRLCAWITAYLSQPRPRYSRASIPTLSTSRTEIWQRNRPDLTILPV